MLLIQALFILLSERGFSRKSWYVQCSAESFNACSQKFVGIDLLALKAPYKNDQVQNIRWIKKKKAMCSLQLIFCYKSCLGKIWKTSQVQ